MLNPIHYRSKRDYDFIYCCPNRSELKETKPAMVDPIHQFQITKLFTIGKIDSVEIALTNSANFELLCDLGALRICLVIVECQSFFAAIWVGDIYPIESAAITVIAMLRRNCARAVRQLAAT